MRTTLDIIIESDTSYKRAPKKRLYKYEEILNKYGQLIEARQISTMMGSIIGLRLMVS